jgi:Transcription termination factor nusG.
MEQWYLACHKAGKQNAFKAMTALCMSSCTIFHPQNRVYRERTDRPGQRRQVIEPLFPGYLFIAFDPECVHTSTIERCPGISYLVRTAGQIKPIRDCVMEELMLLPLCSQDRDKRHYTRHLQQRRIAHQLDDFVKKTTPEERGTLFLAFLNTL